MVEKLLIESLTNERLDLIYLEIIRQRGDIVIHLADRMEHISGYYLLRITEDGMSKFEDVGNTDRPGDTIRSIDTHDMGKLKIIGVDLV